MAQAVMRGAVVNGATGGATQDFTVSGFTAAYGTPKAALFIVTARASSAGSSAPKNLGIGFTDGTNHRGISALSRNAQASSDTRSQAYDNTILRLLLADGSTDDAILTFNSWITDGVRVNLSRAFDAACRVQVILFGGADMSVAIGTATPNAVGGAVINVNTGFEPDVLFCISDNGAFNETLDTGALLNCFSIATNLQPGARVRSMSMRHTDNQGTTSPTMVFGDSDLAHFHSGENTPLTILAGTGLSGADPFTSSGFDIESVSHASGTTGPTIGYLALKLGGAPFHLDTYATPTSTGNQAYTAPGFRPTSALAFLATITGTWGSLNEQSGSEAGAMGFGFLDASYAGSLTLYDEDSAPTFTNTSSRYDDAPLHIREHTDTTAQYTGALDSFNEYGLTFNFTVAPGSAQKFVLLTLGDEWPPRVSGPRRARSQPAVPKPPLSRRPRRIPAADIIPVTPRAYGKRRTARPQQPGFRIQGRATHRNVFAPPIPEPTSTTVSDLELRYLGRELLASLDDLPQYTASGGTSSSAIAPALTEANDYWNGAIIRWDSGPNAGLYSLVRVFVAATDTLAFETELPAAVAAGHQFTLIHGGKYASAQRVPGLKTSPVVNVTGFAIAHAAHLNDEGTGVLSFDHSTGTMTWQPPGGEAGDPVSVGGLDPGDSITVYGAAEDASDAQQRSRFVQLTRTTASLPAADAADDVSLDIDPGSFLPRVAGSQADAGTTLYRPVAIVNAGPAAVPELRAYCASPLPDVASTTVRATLGTGAGTLAGEDFEGWGASGWVHNVTKGDIRYFVDRSGNSAVVLDPAGGQRGFTAVAWDVGDVIQPFPWSDIGLDAPAGGDVFEDPADHETAPSGVSFSCPLSEAAGVLVGTLAAGGVHVIWLRFEIPAGARPLEGGRVDLRVRAHLWE